MLSPPSARLVGWSLFVLVVLLLPLGAIAARWTEKTLQEDAVTMVEDLLLSADTALHTGVDWAYKAVGKHWHVHKTTIRKWHKHYLKFGEVPCVTRRWTLRFLRLAGGARKIRKGKMTEQHLEVLRSILREHPEFYLDEFVDAVHDVTGVWFHPSTIWRTLHDRLNYRLNVVSEVARNRNEEERRGFYRMLDFYVSNINQLLILDESSKGRNASRRRRGWACKGNTNTLNRWFNDHVDYCLLGACNIHGFVSEACWPVPTKESVSLTGASGTIDAEIFLTYFEYWVIPVLGSYDKGEPNSIVLMDNASIHHKLRDRLMAMAWEEKGVIILFTAPYSPDINPIEFFFSVYKAYLKREHNRPKEDWLIVHLEALSAVSAGMARRTFAKCEYPGVDGLLEEEDTAAEAAALAAVAAAVGVVHWAGGKLGSGLN